MLTILVMRELRRGEILPCFLISPPFTLTLMLHQHPFHTLHHHIFFDIFHRLYHMSSTKAIIFHLDYPHLLDHLDYPHHHHDHLDNPQISMLLTYLQMSEPKSEKCPPFSTIKSGSHLHLPKMPFMVYQLLKTTLPPFHKKKSVYALTQSNALTHVPHRSQSPEGPHSSSHLHNLYHHSFHKRSVSYHPQSSS